MPARSCSVTFTDISGVRHTVDVAAESLYEAAVLAIAEFRRCALLEGNAPGSVTNLVIAVKQPSTEHRVTVRQIEDWLRGVARSPKEKATKERLKQMIGDGTSG